jgi:hypothetical protein
MASGETSCRSCAIYIYVVCEARVQAGRWKKGELDKDSLQMTCGRQTGRAAFPDYMVMPRENQPRHQDCRAQPGDSANLIMDHAVDEPASQRDGRATTA